MFHLHSSIKASTEQTSQHTFLAHGCLQQDDPYTQIRNMQSFVNGEMDIFVENSKEGIAKFRESRKDFKKEISAILAISENTSETTSSRTAESLTGLANKAGHCVD